MDRVKFIVGFLIMVGGIFLISHFSNWQTATGVFLVVISNNIDLASKFINKDER